jgi:hypothetical protein
MIDWNNATGIQLALAQNALISAYPVPEDFETFLLLRLNKSYALLVSGGSKYGNAITQVLVQAKADGWLGDLIKAAQADKPKNVRLRKLDELDTAAADTSPAGKSVEDIVRPGGFEEADPSPWIDTLIAHMARTCRIEHPVNQGIGTGFLVANDLLLTNWHVVRKLILGSAKPTEYVCRFDYSKSNGVTSAGVTFQLADAKPLSSSPGSALELGTGTQEPTGDELDYALLRLAQSVGSTLGPTGFKRGWIPVSAKVPMPPVGSIVLVLQHPSGDPLKLKIGACRGPNSTGTRMKHDANTASGSSGSPCFDEQLNLIALHCAGDPMYDGVHGAAKENRGVPIGLIVAKLDGTVPTFWT